MRSPSDVTDNRTDLPAAAIGEAGGRGTSPATRRARDGAAVDRAFDESDGVGASGEDSYEAHEGGASGTRSAGAVGVGVRDDAGDLTDDPAENPDLDLGRGDDDDEEEDDDTPVFDKGDELPLPLDPEFLPEDDGDEPAEDR